MDGFQKYFEESEEEEDIKRTLAKLPEAHRNFVRGFKISFQGRNTLNNDGEHVGVVQTHPKPEIIIAAGYRYGRETIFLHEIGHLVWSHLMDQNLQKQWSELVRRTPMKKADIQSDEEMFSMAYASTYSKRPPVTYYKPEWIHFIKQLS